MADWGGVIHRPCAMTVEMRLGGSQKSRGLKLVARRTAVAWLRKRGDGAEEPMEK